MANITELSSKKLHFLRYLSYWLYVICTIGIPVGLIAWQFQIFHKPGPISLTAYGIIAVLVAAFIFRGHLKRAIAELEPCITKTVIINVGKLVPWIAFWFILTFVTGSIEKIKFILFWAIIGNFFAMFLDIWHTALLRECKNRGK